jgi:phosphatidylglycerol:prolipoprotein diacylglycerol transferase
MRQVLFYIPREVDWLPEWLPFSLLLAVLVMLVAGVLWALSRRFPQGSPPRENLRSAGLGVLILGLVVSIAPHALKNLLPEGVPIYGFGMMLFLAFLGCTAFATWLAQREGIAKETIQDVALWIFLGGLLGARILYLIQEDRPASVAEFFTKLPQIWEGGIILYGSVLGALVAYAVAYVLVFRKQKLSTLKVADIAAPTVAIGLMLGRIGCFLNGCCYGQVACADCPVYAVHFPLSAPPRVALTDLGYQTAAGFTLDDRYPGPGARVGKVEPDSAAERAGLMPGAVVVKANGNEVRDADDLRALLGSFRQWPRGKNDLTLELQPDAGSPTPCTFSPRTIGLHPTQIYEAISMFLLLLVLMAFWPLRTRDGQVMALLMIGYGAHRWLNEQLRSDPRPVGFEANTSVLLILAGVALALWLWRRPAQYRTEWKETEPAKAGRFSPAR